MRGRVRDGLLVARAGRGCGFLERDVRREPPRPDGLEDLLIEVEVANFYPSIAVGFSEPVYEMTQSAIHVLVTHAFLRSLAKLDLARSKVGTLAHQPDLADWDDAAGRAEPATAEQADSGVGEPEPRVSRRK